MKISIHALLAESDMGQTEIVTPQNQFLSTLSLRRATDAAGGRGLAGGISIHALLAESDYYEITYNGDKGDFYPRSPCGERPYGTRIFGTTTTISIHALLAESDKRNNSFVQFFNISIHALLAESDPRYGVHLSEETKFLSTLSLRRATGITSSPVNRRWHFYPRSPCGERPPSSGICQQIYYISIHALLAESDFSLLYSTFCAILFLSTLSLRRATLPDLMSGKIELYFYPRSPCGERQKLRVATYRWRQFLSTLSLRRATR